MQSGSVPEVSNDWIETRHHAISDVEEGQSGGQARCQIKIIICDQEEDGNDVVIAL